MNSHLLTDALISEVATGRGGFTREQMGLLGISWPPPKGWRKRLVSEGRVLSGVEFAELRGLRTVTARKGNGVAPSGISHETSAASCPWCDALVTIAKVGGHNRRFCPGTNHRNLYNSAIRRLALWYADLITIPGALQKWDSSSCTTPGRATSPSGVPWHPKNEDGC